MATAVQALPLVVSPYPRTVLKFTKSLLMTLLPIRKQPHIPWQKSCCRRAAFTILIENTHLLKYSPSPHLIPTSVSGIYAVLTGTWSVTPLTKAHIIRTTANGSGSHATLYNATSRITNVSCIQVKIAAETRNEKSRTSPVTPWRSQKIGLGN